MECANVNPALSLAARNCSTDNWALNSREMSRQIRAMDNLPRLFQQSRQYNVRLYSNLTAILLISAPLQGGLKRKGFKLIEAFEPTQISE